jgi:hypothetical protein
MPVRGLAPRSLRANSVDPSLLLWEQETRLPGAAQRRRLRHNGPGPTDGAKIRYAASLHLHRQARRGPARPHPTARPAPGSWQPELRRSPSGDRRGPGRTARRASGRRPGYVAGPGPGAAWPAPSAPPGSPGGHLPAGRRAQRGDRDRQGIVDSVAEVCALRRGEQVDVLARVGEKAVRLNGVAAGKREPEAGRGPTCARRSWKASTYAARPRLGNRSSHSARTRGGKTSCGHRCIRTWALRNRRRSST